uniref:EGF-like domain-containing protein n=1 Tax=Ascaris lumbricoides TaxID=6252 RepID=A0A9J2Q1N3_ASCLU
MSKVRFPPTDHPRTFSARILAGRGPRCFRDLIVQNERLTGCPPMLRRNLYQQVAFECGCDATNTTDIGSFLQSRTDAPTTPTTTIGVVFPIFQLTHPSTTLNTFPNWTFSTQNPFLPLSGIDSFPSTAARNHTGLETRPTTERFRIETVLAGRTSLPDQSRSFVTPSMQSTTTRTLSTQPCAEVECLNNGTCVLGPDGQASCLCLEGFNGARCEFNVCATMPCMNGGICHASGAEASCECPPRFTGVLCEQAICDPVCENGGSCEFINESAVCQCMPGTTGINCNLIDVCAQPSTCAVFGDRARCRIDPQNFALISPIVVNASYTCECPDENDRWVNCLELAMRTASSPPTVAHQFITASSINQQPSAPIEKGVDFASIIPETQWFNIIDKNSSLLNKSETEQHSTSGEVPFPWPTPLHPSHSGLSTPSVKPTNEETAGQKSTEESSQTPVLTTEAPENMNSFPWSTVSATTTTSSIADLFASSSFVHSIIATNNSNVSIPAFPPFSSFTIPTRESTVVDVESAATFSSPMPHAPTSQATVTGIDTVAHFSGLPLSPFEHTTAAGMEESTRTTESPSGIPSITTPETAITDEEFTGSVNSQETQTQLTTLQQPELQTTTEPRLEEETQGQGAGGWQPVIPSHVPETHTEVPEISLQGSGAGEEVVTSEVHRYPIVEPTVASSTGGSIENGASQNEASDDTSKGSSASWIVALVVAIVLLLLVGAAALFVLRYVRRSRKLHGKYNPAREENVLANSYSMPMTTVTKEERLI